METLSDGIWIIDNDAKTAYARQRMATILGTTPAEMIGYSSFDFVFPEDVPAAQQLFGRKKNGDTEPFHFRLRRKDGSAISFIVQGTPMFNEAGKFNGVVGTFTVSH